MSDLDLLRAAPVPRPDPLARRFARRFVPVVAYGAGGLLLWVLAAGVVSAALFQAGRLLGAVGPGWTLAGLFGGYVLAVPVWVPVARHVRAKLEAGRRLFRDGAFTDATLEWVEPHHHRGRPYSVLVLRFGGGEGPRELRVPIGGHPYEAGVTLPVLHAEGCAEAVAFLVAGRAVKGPLTTPRA